MTRVGGRNAVFAWVVGLISAAIVAVLVVLALPMLPASLAWLGEQVNGPVSEPQAGDEPGDDDLPAECRDLYSQPLWATLVWAPDAVLTPSRDLPSTSAAGLIDALAPTVRMTCTWTSAEGEISTTLAEVATDAGAIAATALPTAGFTCAAIDGRTRCTRTDGELIETIEAGGGLWLSTSQTSWQPADYPGRVAEAVWAG
ncbi:hypothetical protein [uncultured Microbacterium sp.]|nr:hypothetical protein [uncultured Microbacterium sp.]